MKFDLSEINFLKNALESCSVKVSDAHFVSGVLVKIDKEFDRLQKIAEKESA